jgi:serine/threonine-protein kinase
MKRVLLFSLCCFSLSVPAFADSASDAESSAKALDSEAVRLRKDGKSPAEYCKNFYASEGMSPNILRKFEVAACLVGERKMASAFAKFKEALQLADAAKRSNPNDATAQKQFDAADAKMAEIEPQLSKLSITVTEKIPGLTVTRGKDNVVEATFGIAIPLDPGTYDIVAKAPGFKAYSTQIKITDPGTQTVTIPKLETGSDAQTCSANEALVAGKCDCAQGFKRNSSGVCAASASTTASSSSSGGSVPAMTWVFGGAGVASLAAGGIFAGLAVGKFNSSKGDGCDAATKLCASPSKGLNEYNDAQTFATVSTVTVIAGIALVGVGAGFLLFGGSKESPARTSLVFTPGGLNIVGSF